MRSSSASFEEKRLARYALFYFFADRRVVRRAVLDGVIEDGRVRGQPCYRQLGYVLLERTAVQQVACNVIEPNALAQIVQQLGCFHLNSSVCSATRPAHTAMRRGEFRGAEAHLLNESRNL